MESITDARPAFIFVTTGYFFVVVADDASLLSCPCTFMYECYIYVLPTAVNHYYCLVRSKRETHWRATCPVAPASSSITIKIRLINIIIMYGCVWLCANGLRVASACFSAVSRVTLATVQRKDAGGVVVNFGPLLFVPHAETSTMIIVISMGSDQLCKITRPRPRCTMYVCVWWPMAALLPSSVRAPRLLHHQNHPRILQRVKRRSTRCFKHLSSSTSSSLFTIPVTNWINYQQQQQ